jgi:16S rRNA (uracil1498-N3)-methyltransferase
MNTDKTTHLNRFFIKPECIADGKVRIDGPNARQICSVLRLGAGDKIAVLDGRGSITIVRITEASPSLVIGDVVQICPLDTEPKTQLTLAQSFPKGDKLEFVIQKGTELGVSKFEVITTARCVPRTSDNRVERRLSRWQTIAKEAAEQSCRAVVPEVMGVTSLKEFVDRISEFDLAICLWEGEERESLRKLLKENSSARSILLIIGPEGGFEESEVRLMQENGAKTASLGRRILRCETAAIAGAAIVLYEMESQ